LAGEGPFAFILYVLSISCSLRVSLLKTSVIFLQELPKRSRQCIETEWRESTWYYFFAPLASDSKAGMGLAIPINPKG